MLWSAVFTDEYFETTPCDKFAFSLLDLAPPLFFEVVLVHIPTTTDSNTGRRLTGDGTEFHP